MTECEECRRFGWRYIVGGRRLCGWCAEGGCAGHGHIGCPR